MGMYVDLSDGQLVDRCRAGDQEAWNELVERFSRYVYAISVQAFKLSEHDAEDVFQEVFTRAYEHLHKLRDDDAIRPWLAQLTRRLCIDRLRAGAHEQPDELVEPMDVDDTIGALDEALAVHEALAILPDSCQDILDRFFARDESYRTIGEALDVPSGRSRAESRAASPSFVSRWREEIHPLLRHENGDRVTAYDEERLGELLSALPPAPEAWVEAAKDAPFARQRSTRSSSAQRPTRSTGSALSPIPKASSKRPTSSRTQRTSRSSASGWRTRSRDSARGVHGRLSRSPLREFLDRMAAEEPTPAGGSAAAIGVAMASALIAKVARVSTDWPDARAVVAQADHLSRRIAPLAQSDAEAYEEALAALHLPDQLEPEVKSMALGQVLTRAPRSRS